MILKNKMIYIADCIFLMRPFLLGPVWTVLLTGWITGYNLSPGGWILNGAEGYSELWIMVAGFSLVTVFIYILNQITDIENDTVNNKLFILPRNCVQIPVAWAIAVVSGISGIVIAYVYFGYSALALCIAAILLGIAYNLSFKDRPWLGYIGNFAGHGVLTYMAGWIAAVKGFGGEMEILRVIPGAAAAGFANGAVFLVTTIADERGDRRTSKKTFCVSYGHKKTAAFAALNCLAAFLCSFFIEYNRLVFVVPAGLSILLFIRLALSGERDMAYKVFKWPVILLSLGVMVYVPSYAGLILAVILVNRIYYRYRFGITYPSF